MAKREQKLQKIITNYLALYRELRKNAGFKGKYFMKLTDNQKTMIVNFIERIGEEKIGDVFLKDYFEFQFNYYFSKHPNRVERIMLSWILGKPAIERWEKREKPIEKFKVKKVLYKQVNVRLLPLSSEWKEMLLNSTDNEETEKERFLNTEIGLNWCYANTTLYNHKSHNCLICKYADDCKKLLGEEHENLYKLRGYGQK